jgi:hypothetical protein
VRAFFGNILGIYVKTQFQATKICNLDETGNSNVQNSPKIIFAKGFNQVGIVTLGDRWINVTMIVDVYFAGTHVPPVLM